MAFNVQECCPVVALSHLVWQPWAPLPLRTLLQAGWSPAPTLLAPTLYLPGPLQGCILLGGSHFNCHFLLDSPTLPTGVDMSNIIKMAPKVSADGPQEPSHAILQVGGGSPCGQG